MAAAFANFVTCDICFEVYEDPQELSCRHTFCIKCVHKIKGQTTIQCPICKASSNLTDVKSDFKTAALLETYLGEQKQQQSEVKCNTTGSDDITGSKDGVKLCDVCFNKDEGHKVVCKCKDCDYLLCKHCEGLHRSDDVTKEHVVLSLVKVVSEAKIGLKKVLEELQEKKDKLSNEQNQLRKSIGNLDSTEKEALEKITQEEEELMAQIKIHHDELRDVVHKSVVKAKGTMKENEMNMRKKCKELQARMVTVKYLLEHNTDVVVAEIGNTVCQEIKLSLVTTEENELDSRMTEFTLDLNVIKGSGYQKDQGTSVNVVGGLGENLKDCQTEGFAAVTDIDYKKDNSVLIKEYQSYEFMDYVPTLSFIGDEILYLLSNTAYFYNTDLELIRNITFSATTNILAIVQTKTRHYITTCARNGLNVHDDTGKHLQQISPDIYSALYLHNKEIYAYNSRNNELCTFGQTPHFWKKANKEVEFDHKGLNDKVHMTHDEIYISAKVEKCVRKYNYYGMLLKTYGMSEEEAVDQNEVKGQLEDPVVCSVDGYGNILVFHGSDNNRKCRVFTESGQSSVLSIVSNNELETVLIDLESQCVLLAVSNRHAFYKDKSSCSYYSSYSIMKCKPNILPEIL